MRIKSLLLCLTLLILPVFTGCTSAQLQSAQAKATKLQNATQTAANATTQPVVQGIAGAIPDGTAALSVANLALGGLAGLFGLTSAVLATINSKKTAQVTNLQNVVSSAADQINTAHNGIIEMAGDILNFKQPTVPWSTAFTDLLATIGLSSVALPATS